MNRNYDVYMCRPEVNIDVELRKCIAQWRAISKMNISAVLVIPVNAKNKQQVRQGMGVHRNPPFKT